MRRDDLMKPDVLSEAVLLGIGILIFVALVLTGFAALTRIAPLP
jgi:hypothetical protein